MAAAPPVTTASEGPDGEGATSAGSRPEVEAEENEEPPAKNKRRPPLPRQRRGVTKEKTARGAGGGVTDLGGAGVTHRPATRSCIPRRRQAPNGQGLPPIVRPVSIPLRTSHPVQERSGRPPLVFGEHPWSWQRRRRATPPLIHHPQARRPSRRRLSSRKRSPSWRSRSRAPSREGQREKRKR